MDASFVSLERPNAPMHIGNILIYDPSTAPNGFVRFKDILEFIRPRLALSKTMRQRLVKVPFSIDYPYWIEDPDFDLEYHIRHIALPKPGDWRQLCIQAARLFSRPLDMTRPPWEITVIEGLDNVEGVPKGSYAMVSKVHHAAIDGMSGIDMMNVLHTLTADPRYDGKPDRWKSERLPSQVGLFARGYVRGLLNPVRQLDAVRKMAPGAFRAAKGFVKGEFELSPLLNTPRTRFNGTISSARVVEGRSFPLAGIKAIRSLSEGCKVNDVMLAIVGGALNKYLTEYDDLPDTSMTAMAPISVRAEQEKNTMGNQVSAMVVPLGSHIADATERLAYVHEQTIKSKAMTNAIGAREMTEVSKVSPNFYVSMAARLYSSLGIANRIKPMFNTVVTNVPGPPIPIYSAGAKAQNIFGLLCLLDGMGLGHVVQSYVDKSTITFTACRDMLPDPEYYAECLQASYDDLAKAAGYTEAVESSAAVKPKAKSKRSMNGSQKAAKPASLDQATLN
ncbi:MAG: wax ester/triacylglycerol synthase family O-acyltransferase [Rhizobiales bacterium]|nr:wax ester/triacylglycerol synthase family O-acyltransferase [Hyphomicrobiales bacterium]